MPQKLTLTKISWVPTIAIIGSGGGMRAVVGMCGAMTALQNEGILDYTMYTAGLSGSAWYLMTLYADDETLDATLAHRSIRKRLVSFRLRDILKLRHDIFKRDAGFLPTYKLQGWREFFNLTRRFGDTIGNLLLPEKSYNKWSEQTTKLKDGNVPLPLLAALHVRGDKTITAYNEWIELSPYEVFIPKYGAAIDMKDFGDEFYGVSL
ncbi:CPLA2 [Mytilus edulis]|uniref:PLA2G4 n=1 Tax=Mytilus edulis TaxID=6550 RepID=A0A8S3U8V8_MYTED|nr:CPLA2 [Mytilus edulis]